MTPNPLAPLLVLLHSALLPPPVFPSPGAWQWPLEAPVGVIRPFAPPPSPWLPGHRGVDLAAQPGQQVFATGPGTVTFARDLAGRGVITVTHGLLRTTYQPVHALIRRGARATPGTLLGTMEPDYTHCPQTLCLHWGLRRGPTYLDPLSLVAPPLIRLLPHWPRS
ncbi:MAG: M23 family metallopeptidase [Streptosporangiaceae bacterium]